MYGVGCCKTEERQCQADWVFVIEFSSQNRVQVSPSCVVSAAYNNSNNNNNKNNNHGNHNNNHGNHNNNNTNNTNNNNNDNNDNDNNNNNFFAIERSASVLCTSRAITAVALSKFELSDSETVSRQHTS